MGNSPSSSQQDMSQIATLVNALIKENFVIVFSKSYCPYCTRAKQILQQLGKQFKVIELDNEGNGAAIQSYLAQLTGQRTVPNIFIKGEHIGGCDDLQSLQRQGKLAGLLKD
ncbi:thioredoxin-like protein [Paraphysoderma sedebokerense]|nr:thioredoxin-like protein [Paraphysoderma sedebokerense]